MIDYEPDRWQVRFLFQISGSVYPKALVWAIPSTILAALLHQYVATRETELNMSLFGTFHFALSFTIVFRSQQAYSRYWEAGTIIQRVRGNWFNAVSACFAFCNPDEEYSMKVQTFKHTVVRLISLLYCSALQQVAHCSNEAFEIIDISGFDQDSMTYLSESPEKAWVVLQWIQQLITNNHRDGTLSIPAPILSRVFNELSNGIVSTVDAQKITDIPFPFPLAQMVSSMLIIMSGLTPAVFAEATDSLLWCCTMNFFSILCLFSIHYIAAEIEMPFGDDDNDLPLAQLQVALNTALIQLLDEDIVRCPSYELSQESYICRTLPCPIVNSSSEQFRMISTSKASWHDKARSRASQVVLEEKDRLELLEFNAARDKATSRSSRFSRVQKEDKLASDTSSGPCGIPIASDGVDDLAVVLKEQEPISHVTEEIELKLTELTTQIRSLLKPAYAGTQAELPSKKSQRPDPEHSDRPNRLALALPRPKPDASAETPWRVREAAAPTTSIVGASLSLR